ncbi:hypothetical protein LJC42_07255 [Eubacteriales bacterium OttesenSCG-928-K08]|nr:hypothetical protein [Eubacteriales bacterium OttesenSCG-928-K08]
MERLPKQEKPTKIRAAQRGIWFFMRTILLIAALCFLCYGVFMTAMHIGNLHILTTEGLQLRTECILQEGAQNELPEYFTDYFIAGDKLLDSAPYEDFTITNYDYRVEVESIKVWPWSKTATVTVTDRMMSLNGAIREDKKEEGAGEDKIYPMPEWESGRYAIRFKLDKGRWYINQMQLLEVAPTQTPKRTPDMSQTPVPLTTPTPASQAAS